VCPRSRQRNLQIKCIKIISIVNEVRTKEDFLNINTVLYLITVGHFNNVKAYECENVISDFYCVVCLAQS
jgi:hypothetical protein